MLDLVGAERDATEDHGAREVQEVVGHVEREEVEARARVGGEEEAHDAEGEVGDADDAVDGPCRTNAGDPGDQQGCADEEMRDVVQWVDLEDAENEPALRCDESDAARVCEAEESNQQVDGPEDRADQAIG